VVVKSDDQQWKEFVTKPSLRFILRALTGLSVKHSPTQLAVSDSCVPILHQIEQVNTLFTLPAAVKRNPFCLMYFDAFPFWEMALSV